jgi:hypothetical protein
VAFCRAPATCVWFFREEIWISIFFTFIFGDILYCVLQAARAKAKILCHYQCSRDGSAPIMTKQNHTTIIAVWVAQRSICFSEQVPSIGSWAACGGCFSAFAHGVLMDYSLDTRVPIDIYPVLWYGWKYAYHECNMQSRFARQIIIFIELQRGELLSYCRSIYFLHSKQFLRFNRHYCL